MFRILALCLLISISSFAQLTRGNGSGVGGASSAPCTAFASTTETSTGTDTSKCVHPAGVAAAIATNLGFLPSVTSTALTVAAGTYYQHDLLTAVDQTVGTLSQINITGITTGATTTITVASAPSANSFGVGHSIAIELTNSGCAALDGVVHVVTTWNSPYTSFVINTNTASGCTPTATGGVYGQIGANASAAGTIYACLASGTITYVHPASAGMYITGTGDFVQRQETTPSCHPTTAGNPEVGWKTVATVDLTTTSNGTYNTGTLATTRGMIDSFDFLPGTGLTCSYTSGVLTCATSADVARLSADNAFTGGFDATAVSYFRVRTGSADPGTCTANTGELFYNTTSDVLKQCSATNTWSTVGSDSTSVSNSGSTGASVLKTSTNVTARKIIGESGTNVTENTDDITIGYRRQNPAYIYIQENFVSGSPAVNTTTLGTNSWKHARPGSGGSIARLAGTSSMVGGVQLSSSATSGEYSGITLQFADSNTSFPFYSSHTMDYTVLVTAGHTDTNTYYRMGFCDAGYGCGGTVNNGWYITKATADSTWTGVCVSGGSATSSSSLGSVTTSAIAFRVRRIDSTTIGFRSASTLAGLDAASETTVTSNCNAATAVAFGISVGNNTTADKTLNVYYADLLITRP